MYEPQIRRYGVVMVIAAFMCLAFAVHASLALDAAPGLLLFLPVVAYHFAALTRRGGANRRVQSRIFSSPHLAAIAAAGCFSLVYVLTAIFENMSVKFVIGDSDSLLYHLIAEETARNFSATGVASLELVQKSADSLGYVVANRGMYWFLGAIYTLVGLSAGPGSYLFVNAVCAMIIAHFSVLIANMYSDRRISRSSAVIFAAMIFLNVSVAPHALHLRKDFLTVAAFVSALYCGLNRRWIWFLVLAGVVAQLRFFFLAPLAVPALLGVRESLLKRDGLPARKVLALLFVSIGVIGIMPSSLFSSIGLVSSVGDAAVMDSLAVTLKGSAFFAQNSFFQWFYVLLYPFPPLSLGSYFELAGWLALAGFLVDVYLCYWLFIEMRRAISGRDNISTLLAIWSGLFLLLLINLKSAAAAGLLGVVEPRYKFAWFVLSGIIMMASKNSPSRLKLGIGARQIY